MFDTAFDPLPSELNGTPFTRGEIMPLMSIIAGIAAGVWITIIKT